MYETKEKVCKKCDCNLLMTRKRKYNDSHISTKGDSYFHCLDCDQEVAVKWVVIKHYDPQANSFRLNRLSNQVINLRKQISRQLDEIEKLLLRVG
tara:strand:+ start:230 stop:514 length:285 start_codon:yes stop_codon:yes gene_type:complete